MKTIRFHQGDVIGMTITSIPVEAERVTNQPIAYGEHSGHQHCLTGDVKLFKMPDGSFIATVGKDGACLQHVHENYFSEKDWVSIRELQMADHKPHRLPEGKYKLWIRQNYNPYSKLMQQVID